MYNVVDYVLAPDRWKNIITNVEPHPQYAFNSDNLPVIAGLRVKLKRTHTHTHIESTHRYTKPAQEQLAAYNGSLIFSVQSQIDASHSPPDTNRMMDIFLGAMKDAAEDNLTRISPKQKQSYVSAETWLQIEERQQSRGAARKSLTMSWLRKSESLLTDTKRIRLFRNSKTW